MDFLKKIYPTPFKVEKGNVKSLAIQLVIFIALLIVFSVLMGVLAHIPVLNVILFIVGPIVDIYAVGGIVILLLKYFDVIQ